MEKQKTKLSKLDAEWNNKLRKWKTFCNSMVLAYQPNQTLDGYQYYIPSSSSVMESFFYAVRKMFDIENQYKAMKKLGKNMNEGIQEIIMREPIIGPGHEVGNSHLDDHLGYGNERFNHRWVMFKGDLFKFASEESRNQALKEFNEYWKPKEKATWSKLHELMREYTAKEFERKK